MKQENNYVDKSRLTLTHLMKQKRNIKELRQIRPKNNFQNTSQQ